jgi:hypothetical protein
MQLLAGDAEVLGRRRYRHVEGRQNVFPEDFAGVYRGNALDERFAAHQW